MDRVLATLLAQNIRQNATNKRNTPQHPPSSPEEIKKIIEEILKEDEESEEDQANIHPIYNVLFELTESSQEHYQPEVQAEPSSSSQVLTDSNDSNGNRKQSQRLAAKKRALEEANDGNNTSEEDDDEEQSDSEQKNEIESNKATVIYLNCNEENCAAQLKSLKLYNQHLCEQHHLKPYRCPAMDCGKRFVSSSNLNHHIKVKHQNIKEWTCGICPRKAKRNKFNIYPLLAKHMYQYHQVGKFQCNQDGCHFTASNRKQIENHRLTKHRPKARYLCQYEGCGKSFKYESELARHEHVHLTSPPYSCSWPDCDYSCKHRRDAVTHIRMKHFQLPKSVRVQKSKNIVDGRNPNEYIRVNEALKMHRLN